MRDGKMVIYQHAAFIKDSIVPGSVTEEPGEARDKVDTLRGLGYDEAHVRTMSVEFGAWMR